MNDLNTGIEVEFEALKVIIAVVAEMGRPGDPGDHIRLLDLDIDGRMHDAPDDNRGVEEDAAFEASLLPI